MAHTKTENGAVNTNEMAVANKLVKQLMEENDITIKEIEMTTDKSSLVIKDEMVVGGLKGSGGWITHLATAVASFYDCEVVIHANKKLVFVGFEIDVKVTLRMIDFIRQQLIIGFDKIEKTQVSPLPKADRRTSFCIGAVSVIRSRLIELKAESKAKESVNALVVVKDKVVKDEFGKMFPNLTYGRGIKYKVSSDYVNGREFGKTVNLNNSERLQNK